MSQTGWEFCPTPKCNGEVHWEEDGGDVSVKLDGHDRPACPVCGTEFEVNGVDWAIETVHLNPIRKAVR